MASVGTELRPTIVDYPQTKKLRTPSRTRHKKVVTSVQSSSKPSPPSKKSQPKLEMPPEPQKTLDVDEHLDKLPVKPKPALTKPKEKSVMVAIPKENAKEPKAGKGSKKSFQVHLPPSSADPEIDKTQRSSDN